MLILIAGITGTIGHYLTKEALGHGHKVRGLGRTKSKMDSGLLERIEFITTDHYFDQTALQTACEGCDAVICAYPIIPELQLEAQLFLLRAAERAGVKRYIANSWSGDYRRLQLGDMESYDPYICFRAQSQLESSIGPNYIFIGVFAETFFNDYHPGTDESSCWVRGRREVTTWGSGDEVLTVTPMCDAAAYTIRVLERDDAADGGDWFVFSFQHSLKEMVEIFNNIGEEKKQLVINGTLDDLRKLEMSKRVAGSKLDYWKYLTWTYWLNLLSGRMEGAKDSRSAEFPEDCRTPLREWLIGNHI